VALIDPSDIRRLFEVLVAVLGERDPARLRTGFQVAELYQQLVPYRTHRAVLGFVSHQDYEAAVLGLLAGTGGYATLEPADAQEALAAEAASPNPDPTLFREFAGARVRLDDRRVRAVREEPSGDAAYAPPPEPPDPGPKPRVLPFPDRSAPVFELERPAEDAAPEAPAPAAKACTACGGALPGDRPVVFCPFCGRPVGAERCTHCGDELRPEWQFCPRCGHARDA
jgi:hypothetical protein